MLRPDSDTIMKLAKKYSVIPISRELFGDSTTPIAILRKLAQNSSRYYLLESVEGGEKWGRYSFLGYDPVMRVTCHGIAEDPAGNGGAVGGERPEIRRSRETASRIGKKTARVVVEENKKKRQIEMHRPLEILRDILKNYRSPVLPELPPFTGGYPAGSGI